MSSVIDINPDEKKAICKDLSALLADTYTLYLKTHNYHWNVTGPMFSTLHLVFETHYNELALAVDLIAERIRALGERAPASYAEFGKLTSIKEATGEPKAMDMVKHLLGDHEIVGRTASKSFPSAEKAGDQATMDLLTQRLQIHEKTAWMLRSFTE